MKSLKDALVDYDLAQLQSLAYKRGIKPPQTRGRETLQTFVDDLLSPASVAIAVADLTAAERAALERLVAAGGFVEARLFARLYGPIRTMGSNRLLREKPWESPANPAEGLWYRGLVFKGFHHTPQGPEEIVFIPHDLHVALPVTPAEPPAFQVSLASQPAHVRPASLLVVEDLFTLLIYLQSNLVRVTPDNALPDNHRRALQAQFAFFEYFRQLFGLSLEADEINHWFDFILHLARRLDFLRKQGQRLKLNSNAVKDWLQKTAWEQTRHLQDTWRNDPTWNDLWHIPGLRPKPTGWENSPMLGRSKIFHYLRQLPAAEWVDIATFAGAIKRAEPDFQRPGGDYQSWYIYDAAGNPLMGFEHWDAVEGALINHLIVTVLFALGVVDLGAPGDTLPAEVFKITALGRAFLSPETAAVPAPPPEAGLIRINPTDFSVKISVRASLYDRFQLARFARLLRRETKYAVYQIDRQSYHNALEQSITLEQILAFLSRVTHSQTPLPLVEAVRNWDRRAGAVKLERLTVLRVNQADLLTELLNHPRLGPLLGPPLGPEAVLVPEKHVAAARKALVELGYLAE